MMEYDIDEPKGFSLHDTLSLFLRKRLYFILPFFVIFLSVLSYAFLSEAVYRSSAKVLIEQSSLQNDKVTSLAGAAEHRIQIISEKILTRKNLKEIIMLYGLYPEQYINAPELAIKTFREAISLRPINTELVDPRTGRMRESTIAFLVAFEYTSPEVAKQVADHLVALFLEKNEISRKNRVEKTSSFLVEQADKLAIQVEEQERKLAEFKRTNAGNLPELQDVNLQVIERSERQLITVSEELRSLREQAIFVEAELSQTSKI